MKIIVEHEIDDIMIDDICVTAFEGGINYWCDEAKILESSIPEKFIGMDLYASQAISRGASVELFDIEEEEIWLLTPENFQKGLERCANEWNLNLEDLDADDVDRIIQYALFGEIIFG